MSETLRWWFLLVVIGTLMLPLCFAVFRRLPDRGYALSKPFGLLLLGYLFWLLNSFHILPNDGRGIIGAALPLIALSAWFAYREWDDLVEWVREHWHYIVGVEALFFVAFITAVWLRTTVGEIVGTEQPMDLMFLNAARQADYFPPEDPWLAGETVAYYWFGYLLVAMMSELASVPGDVAYNIGLGMIAAMAFVGASGIVYSLVFMREEAMKGDNPQSREPRARENKSRRRRQAAEGESSETATASTPASIDWAAINWRPYVFGFGGGLILIVMGNLVYALTFASAYAIGGSWLYDWLEISGLMADEPRYGQWYPADFFQFFGATRIYSLDNAGFYVITEFPMFSFLLGDLHPHVMALPFVLLVVGLALSLYRSEEPLDITFWLQRPLLLLAAGVLLGGLTFINTWDIATFSFVIIAAVFVSNFMRVRALTSDLFVQVASFAAPLVILAFLFYVPFLTSIAGNSQADSFNAVVTNDDITVAGTRPVHMLLFWGSLFVLVLPFVGARVWSARQRIGRAQIAWPFAPAAAVLIGWALLYFAMVAIDANNLRTGSGNIFEQVWDRGTAWFTAIVIAACLAGSLLALWAELTSTDRDAERHAPIFSLTMTSVALLLILGCEFFYVGDVFRSRMNTVFKLYYQAWLLLALAGGFSLYYLASAWRFSFPQAVTYRRVWTGAAIVILALAALYPIGGTLNRARPYSSEGLIVVGGSLHGLANRNPDELAAFSWLEERAKGQDLVIAEAVGDDYQENGRVSMATGMPAVLGWLGHENQWRDGTCPPCAGRFEDMEALYRNTDPEVMQQILQKYDVSFVYVGPFERTRYGEAGMAKFEQLQIAFQSGTVTIYRAQ